MKKFLSGVICGTLISGTIAFAANYEAITATFPILINGSEWKTDKPIVTIDGSTYLPLRAVGDVLNVPVNWNSELSRVEIGETTTITPSATYSRNNPAPLNTVQQIQVDNYSEKYTVAIAVKEILSDEESATVLNSEYLKQQPDDGYKFVVAKIAVSMLAVDEDKSISISQYNFNSYSSNNESAPTKIIIAPKPDLSATLYQGGNADGYVAFQVPANDKSPKISFGTKYDGSGGIWFSLSK